jgi:3-hydroxyacyl-[acyl-carrier-protein] dehydratase
MLDIYEILKRLPHRYPFLLIDRVLEIVPGDTCQAIKNVTMNEPQFQGHWPENPMFPGVLVLEAMAQVGAICVLSCPENAGMLAVFAGIDGVRFRRQVIPGDQMVIDVRITRRKAHIGKAEGIARVGGEIVCEGEFTFAFIQPPGGNDGPNAESAE